MSKKINIIVNCPSPKDSTSFYRGMGPMNELGRVNSNINMIHVGEYSWHIFGMADLFFLQRPFSKAHLEMMNMAKDNGVPVWVDYDDDLFSVPVSNPAYRAYGNDDIKRTIANITATADVVTVSTPFLKRQLEKGPQPLNRDIRVLPNALNDRLFKNRQKPTGERRKVILWRGSHTHHKDLHHYLDPIVQAVNSDSTWTWLFQGDKPWFLFERLGNNAVFADPIDPIQYFKQMHITKPPVMIVPLHDCEFNRSKSNIAWLEGAYFGAMSLGPDWEEWQRPGCVNYSSVSDFSDKIKAIMRGEFDPTTESDKAWDYIQGNLLLSQTNKIRMKVIEDLFG